MVLEVVPRLSMNARNLVEPAVPRTTPAAGCSKHSSTVGSTTYGIYNRALTASVVAQLAARP
jgi:hypothetical protein